MDVSRIVFYNKKKGWKFMFKCDECGEKVAVNKFTCLFDGYKFKCPNCGEIIDIHDFDELFTQLQLFRIISSWIEVVISGLVWRTLYKNYPFNLFIFIAIFIYIAISFFGCFILSPFYYKIIEKYFR